ncbi:hypothetical protein, partial [Aeromonas salmonicida]|uniref:hypothetical protein n=1 Tax=Aeromonas salmonicida TaxID=645 RepID=UPI003CFD5218
MSTTADSTADDALDPCTAMWQWLFPDALASCHGLIAHKLTQAIGADVKLGPDLTTLLAPDWQWITHCLDDHLVALPPSGDIPLSLAQLDVYGDGIHLTVAHKREWSYGFKPDNKTVPLPCYLESPYDHQRE